MNGQAKRASSKRTLPPAMRLEGEKRAIEKKLEVLKSTMKKTSERGRRMENAEPKFSRYLPGQRDPPGKLESRKRVFEERFMIKEVSGPVYNFKESRSRLVLRRKVFAKLGKGDESADLTEMSTAPTQLTNRVYVPLEDSLEEAELNDLLYQPVKEGSAPMKRGGRSLKDINEERDKSIFNSFPEDIKVTEVRLFLEKLGMSKYEGALLRSGFDNMETLLDISDETMKKVEIPIGFRIKFNKVRAEMQFGERPRFSATASNQYDKTVNQVNTGIETDQTPGKPEKKHTSTEAMQTSTDDMATCFGKASLSYLKNTTKYCFKCFRMANTPQESEYATGKYFCSERCLKFYFLEQTIVCSSISCKAMGIKSSGAFGKGNWYCSENCLIQTFPENEPLSEIAEVDLNSVENFKAHSGHTEPQTADRNTTIERDRSFSSQNTKANSKIKEEQPVLLFQDVDLDLDF